MSGFLNREIIQDTGDENGEVDAREVVVCGTLGSILGGLNSPLTVVEWTRAFRIA